MEERRIYRETLQDAAAVLGGMEPLAARLQVSADVVNRWLVGSEKPTLNVFLEALEILAERPWRVAASRDDAVMRRGERARTTESAATANHRSAARLR